jgi:mono/diheme cytochrome c family protein
MTHLRRLFSPLVATLVTVTLGLHTAGALEARGVKQYGALPARFLTIIRPVASANLVLQANAQKPENDDSLPDGKGKDVTQRVCSGCHGVNVFSKERHTPEKWASIVDTMVSRGLDAPDADLATINTYLSTYLAPPKDAPPAPSPAPPTKQ